MACCLMPSNHYPKQCWFIIGCVLSHSPEDNSAQDSHDINHWNVLGNGTFKIAGTSPEGQWFRYIVNIMSAGDCMMKKVLRISRHSIDLISSIYPGSLFTKWVRGIVITHKVSKPWDRIIKSSYRFEIWHVDQQQCCWSTCHISEWLKNSKRKSCCFETSWDQGPFSVSRSE